MIFEALEFASLFLKVLVSATVVTSHFDELNDLLVSIFSKAGNVLPIDPVKVAHLLLQCAHLLFYLFL